MRFRECQETEFAFQIHFDGVTLVTGQSIPFIDSDYQCTPRLKNESGNMRILFRNILLRIEQQQHHICFGDRLQGFDY